MNLLSLILAAFFATLLVASPAAAARHGRHTLHCHHSRHKRDTLHGSAIKRPSAQASLVQVDGILSGVVDQLWAQNNHYWHVGDYPRIIALDRIIVLADPQFIECYNTGAWLMWSSGLDRDAEAFYLACARNNPHTSAAYYDYGFFLYNHMHRYPDAQRVFQQCTQQPDTTVLDWRMLAHTYEKMEQLDSAIAVWREIKVRWPQGAPKDSTQGDVDTHNLNKDLALQAARASAPPSKALVR